MYAKHAASIKRVSYIVRVFVGIVVGGYLALLLFTASPWAGQWMARKVATTLSHLLSTDVQVGRIHLGLFNRIVIDDLLLFDKQGDTLLTATRLSAKMDPWQLMHGRYHIANAQLFGYDIRLRRPSPSEPYNFQFIIDQLSNEDSASAPLDLAVQSVIVRRGRLSHEVRGSLSSAGTSSISPIYSKNTRDETLQLVNFRPSSFSLEDLALHLSIKVSDEKGIDLNLKELRFRDSSSGLIVNNLSARTFLTKTSTGSHRIFVSNLHLQLPASDLYVPRFDVNDSFSSFRAIAHGHITPADFSPLLPLFDRMPEPVSFSTQVNLDNQRWQIPRLAVKSSDLLLQATGSIHDDGFDAVFQQFHMGNTWLLSTLQTLQDVGYLTPEMTEQLQPIGKVDVQGDVSYHFAKATADVTLSTLLGMAELHATVLGQDDFKGTLQVGLDEPEAVFGLISFLPSAHNITLNAEAEGSIRKKNVHARVLATDLSAQGEHFAHMQTEFHLSPQALQGTLQLAHPDLSGNLEANVHATKELDFTTESFEQLTGQLHLNNLHFRQGNHLLDLDGFHVTVDNDTDGHHLHINGDGIEVQADGLFRYTTVVSTCHQLLHAALPSLIPQPTSLLSTDPDQMDFTLRLWDADSLFSMIGVDLHLPQSVLLEGHINGDRRQLILNADAPHILFAGEEFSSVSLIARQQGEYLRSFVTLQRWMEGEPIHITLTVDAEQDQLETFATWEGSEHTALSGQLSAKTRFLQDTHQHLAADVHLNPSQIIIADTVWNVHEANLQIRNQHIDVQGFKITQRGRHLQVDGVVSPLSTDTLRADLRGINLEYVFGLLDFHDVELAGVATGSIKATDLMTQPRVNATLDINNFHFENTLLGHLNVTGGWGRVAPSSIDLDGWITEPLNHQPTRVQGTITPGHGPDSGLDIDVRANNLNAGFIMEYASGIFQDFIGLASGHARIHGPFSQMDLDGALAMDTLAMSIGSLGTRYHSLGRDSVWLSPEGVRVKGFQMFDPLQGSDSRDHRAVVDGQLTWQHFKNIHYSFDITANDLLGYDFRDFGDEVFYATILASGTCNLSGDADRLDVKLQGSPSAGSTLTYNASTPETLTNNQFITFVNSPGTDSPDSPPALPFREGADSFATRESSESQVTADTGLDIHISFNVQVTPEAQVRLLMDPRSEDYITLYGNGGIRATYHNKGRFQMYGTYRVDRGTYRLTLQDVIRKDFQFQQGGTIVFGGAPMKAGLNLQAVYTVPSVSLNDLAAGSNFSASNVRVNCLMNIGGLAEQPQVTFDFDIPNVNEDEKQMVRALISTDEERNLQVIYLLGIGRFYTYGLDPDQNQTNTAMQSLLSSTLSGQLNDILSNTIGNQNWNFGTSLSTGTQGWSDMDVEGMLSGRLLDNRLLINGTFGYRDTPVANTNFIGDFDIQWLLNPSGTLSLKAYSQTNDRYFTKTALTTQGIGLRVHKDFSSLRELFRRKKTESHEP